MRKNIYGLIFLILMLCVLFNGLLPVDAVEPSEDTVTIATYLDFIAPDQPFEVLVNIENAHQVVGYQLSLNYDATQFEIIDVTSDTYNQSAFIFNIETPGQLIINFSDISNYIEGNLPLFTIHFKPLRYLVSDSYPILSINQDYPHMVTVLDDQDQLSKITNLHFDFSDVLIVRYGDINLDGVVDIIDAGLIQLYLAGQIAFDTKESIAADVNADGKISLIDVAYIQLFIAKKIDYLGLTNPNEVFYRLSLESMGELLGQHFLLNAGDPIPTLPVLTQPDAVFLGWFMEASFLTPFDLSVMPSEDITLYAQWNQTPTALIKAKNMLIIDTGSQGVSKNLNLPITMTVTEDNQSYDIDISWSSSDPSIISDQGIVNRPDVNTQIVLTATLLLDDHILTKEFEVVVLAALAAVEVENINEAISISRSGVDLLNFTRIYVSIKDVTIMGITSDGVIFADDSGLLFAYMGTRRTDLVVGGVYDVKGFTDRFFGGWQLSNTIDSEFPVLFTESDGAPTVFTPVEVASVSDMLENHHVPSPEQPEINYVYYRLTAKVRVQNAVNNYGTVLVNPDYMGGDISTEPGSDHTDLGVIVLYQSNKAAFEAFDGMVVTVNVLLYGYRGDRYIFSVMFLESADDIVITVE